MNKILFSIMLLGGVYTANAQPNKDSIICGYSEPMPEAPYNVQKFLADNVIYPKDAEAEGIDGRVILQFIVTETGTLDSITIAKPLYPSLDAEALRLAATMPPWKPGKKRDGTPVRVSFKMPVIFRLE